MYATNYDISYRTGYLVDEDKNAYCWGNNSNRELSANSEATHSHETVQTNTSTGVTSVAVGNMVSCFLLEDKTIECAGAKHRSTWKWNYINKRNKSGNNWFNKHDKTRCWAFSQLCI